jgi:cell division control protein 7
MLKLPQRIGKPQTHGACLHGSPTKEYPHGRLSKFAAQEIEHIKKMQRDARIRSGWASDRVGYPENDLRSVCWSGGSLFIC